MRVYPQAPAVPSRMRNAPGRAETAALPPGTATEYQIHALERTRMSKRAEAKKSTDTRQKEPDSRAKAAAAATAPSGENEYHIADPGEFARNMVQVGIQSQRLLS